MNLSDDLKYWRAERPDEWTMDRFIKEAEEHEKLCFNIYMSMHVSELSTALLPIKEAWEKGKKIRNNIVAKDTPSGST